jgi:homoserine dehydrogenase
VSIESVIQRGAHEDGSVLLVVVTHDSSESAIAETLRTLSGSDNLLAEPVVMPILD